MTIIDEYTNLPISTKLKWYRRHKSLKARGGVDMRGKLPRQKKGEYRKCLNCGIEIYVMQSVIKKGRGKYCSMKCYGKKGFTPEHREKISKGLTGKKLSPEHRAKVAKVRLGMKATEDTRLKQRLAHLGSKSPLWRGGIWNKERMNYHHNKRREVLANAGFYTEGEWYELKRKFNNQCICCSKSEPIISLTVDHVIPLSVGGKNTIDNIQPLCKSCNSRKFVKTIDYRKYA